MRVIVAADEKFVAILSTHAPLVSNLIMSALLRLRPEGPSNQKATLNESVVRGVSNGHIRRGGSLQVWRREEERVKVTLRPD